MSNALELLTTRRSFKAGELAGPAPSAAEVEKLLTVASRVPDHGKLTPWRFIVFEGEARQAAGEAIADAFRAKYPDAKAEHIEAERKRFTRAPLVIAVVSRACPACGNPGMGASAVRRRRRHEFGARGACAGLRRQLDHRSGTLTTATRSMRLGLRRTSALPVSFAFGWLPGVPEDRPRPPLNEIVTRFPA